MWTIFPKSSERFSECRITSHNCRHCSGSFRTSPWHGFSLQRNTEPMGSYPYSPNVFLGIGNTSNRWPGRILHTRVGGSMPGLMAQFPGSCGNGLQRPRLTAGAWENVRRELGNISWYCSGPSETLAILVPEGGVTQWCSQYLSLHSLQSCILFYCRNASMLGQGLLQALSSRCCRTMAGCKDQGEWRYTHGHRQSCLRWNWSCHQWTKWSSPSQPSEGMM